MKNIIVILILLFAGCTYVRPPVNMSKEELKILRAIAADADTMKQMLRKQEKQFKKALGE